MALLTRFVNLIERMVTSLDGSRPLDDEDASGMWMSTGDALDAAPEPASSAAPPPPATDAPEPGQPEPVDVPRVVQLRTAPARPPATPDEAEPEATPEAAAEPVEPNELEPAADAGPVATDEVDAVAVDDGIEEASTATRDEQEETSAEVAESPAVGDAPAEAQPQPAAVAHVAAGGDPADDMLSMFRDASFSSEYADLTKEMEDVTARELLDEARAVLGLLTANRAPSEEDVTA